MKKDVDKHTFDAYNNSIEQMFDKKDGGIQKMKSRAIRKTRKERRVLILAVIVLMATCLFAAFSGLHTVTATSPDSYKYYTHLTVEEGDSLWDIAGRYMGHEYKSRAAYIKEVKEINHLNGSCIYAGTVLVVPYFDTIKK